MKIQEEVRLRLIVAIFAGYSYPLAKAWNLREKVRSSGLVEPEKVIGQDVATVGNLMKAAGYDRSGITYIIAPRLIALMEAIHKGDLDNLVNAITTKSENDFCSSLMKVKGIGSTTAKIAWELVIT